MLVAYVAATNFERLCKALAPLAFSMKQKADYSTIAINAAVAS
jgi:hypothetical protein